MGCCDENENCRQGRNCPYRKPVDFENLKSEILNVCYKLTEKSILLEWIVCLAAALYVASLVIR